MESAHACLSGPVGGGVKASDGSDDGWTWTAGGDDANASQATIPSILLLMSIGLS